MSYQRVKMGQPRPRNTEHWSNSTGPRKASAGFGRRLCLEQMERYPGGIPLTHMAHIIPHPLSVWSCEVSPRQLGIIPKFRNEWFTIHVSTTYPQILSLSMVVNAISFPNSMWNIPRSYLLVWVLHHLVVSHPQSSTSSRRRPFWDPTRAAFATTMPPWKGADTVGWGASLGRKIMDFC